MVENCGNCKHNLSYNYYTIRCSIWTKKICEHLKSNPKISGRMCIEMRCQHYEREEAYGDTT